MTFIQTLVDKSRFIRVAFMFMVAAGVLLAGFARQASAVEDEYLIEASSQIFGPLPETPVFKKDNPGNPAKIQLGKMLYFDTRLSKSGVFSCNSCHNLATAGVDNEPLSTGHKWQAGGRNAPTVLNAALHISQFWDGRAEDVEEQAMMPIMNPVEMAADPDLVVQRLESIPEYVALFEKAFAGSEKPLTFENAAKAIAVFERTLITPSRFDDFMKGDMKALTDDEKAGLELFISTGCPICHSGPTVGGKVYQRFGVLKAPKFLKDKGRFEVTGRERDMNVLKVPSLRNVTRTYPYFHDGSEWSLEHAVWTMAQVQLGVSLDDKQLKLIVTFLSALEGRGVDITLPALPPSTDSTPRPDLD